ncbi:MAG: PIN domain-containing protein [Lautropia sp.]
MKLLLDTDVISDFVRGVAPVRLSLLACPPTDIAVSTITSMEIEYGLARNPERARRIAAMVRSLLDSVSILPFTEEDAAECGRIRAELESEGHPIGLCDAMIAGTARSRALTVITHNVSEFSRVTGLRVRNWHT